MITTNVKCSKSKPRQTRLGEPLRHGFRRHPEDMLRTAPYTLFGVGALTDLLLKPEKVQLTIRCGKVEVQLSSDHPATYLDTNPILEGTPLGTRIKFEAIPLVMADGKIKASVIRPTAKDVFGQDELIVKVTGRNDNGMPMSGRLALVLPEEAKDASAVSIAWDGANFACQALPPGVGF